VSAPAGLTPTLTARLEEFEGFTIDEMDRNARQAAAGSPQGNTIYHYTDVKGALGILNSGRCWLTERAHLNDPSEIKYGADCAVTMAEELAGASPTDLRRFAATYLKNGLNAGLRAFGFYVASFSFDPDDLGQWRAYADQGRGVALGFSSTAFDQDAPGQTVLKPPQTFALRYKRQILKEYQQRGIEHALALLEAPELRTDFSNHHRIAVPWIFTKLAILVVFNSVLFKHPAYGHEKEFRVLLLGEREIIEKHSLHRVRARHGEIVDYLDRPIHPGLSTPGVLTCIRVGPAAPDELVAQVRGTIRSLGIPEPEIDRSDIPFRPVR
jgi:hypothetical protein